MLFRLFHLQINVVQWFSVLFYAQRRPPDGRDDEVAGAGLRWCASERHELALSNDVSMLQVHAIILASAEGEGLRMLGGHPVLQYWLNACKEATRLQPVADKVTHGA